MAGSTAIVRQPGSDLSACELSYQQREPVDAQRLASQHAAYVAALRSAGLNVIILPALADFPDGVYVEDVAIVLDEVAILTRPGALSRRGEVEPMAEVLEPLRTCLSMQEPSTLDGGDVCLHDGVLYVGQGARTNHAGLKELAHLVLEHGYRVKAVALGDCLHLKSALSSLPDGRILVNRDWLNLSRVEHSGIIEAHPSEPCGANVLAVGEHLICSSAYPRTNERLSEEGFDLLEVDLSEVHKMEAAVTCPSLILN
jgi:dimethylargininase